MTSGWAKKLAFRYLYTQSTSEFLASFVAVSPGLQKNFAFQYHNSIIYIYTYINQFDRGAATAAAESGGQRPRAIEISIGGRRRRRSPPIQTGDIGISLAADIRELINIRAARGEKIVNAESALYRITRAG